MALTDAYIESFFNQLGEDASLDKKGIAQLKLALCKTHKIREVPTDIEMLIRAPKHLAKSFRKRLQTKPNRSLSGVAPVAIMTSPAPCPHGKCTTCPGGIASPWGDIPQSYTGVEPATMRAIRANYDAYLQVFNRLEQYLVTGHVADKVDLIVMGGTFPAREESYQDEFIMYAFKAMNDFSNQFFTSDGVFNLDYFKEFFELPGPVGDEDRTKRIQERILKLKTTSELFLEQEKNETAVIRCIGLTIETRPDFALEPHAKKMLAQGCTRVELGVQSTYDDALAKINRGHTVADNKKAARVLKDFGFKLNFHMMLGLPSVTKEQDIVALKTLFTDSDYQPDMLKLYPCMVLAGTQLEKDFKAGLFTPLATDEAAIIIAESIPFVPKFCRIMRVQRDIPTYRTMGGVARTNLRQYVDIVMKARGIVSKDIRAREAGRKKPTKSADIQTTIMQYSASGGEEFFIAIDDVANDILYGFCRLRFPGAQLSEQFTSKTAIIRELHVYGAAVGIGESVLDATQHKGYGKQLVATAERIAKEHGYNKMLVISGVGVRMYYQKLGYNKELPYMAKLL
ncbi:tRNA uridine(34) 5-carboxymethylaminomethyl modification radical SAM/GNAT enzyme Elp3 [Candidatus Woesearchaeota archaeon]|nr:tRNA uridine(34) 5-carboxymethylaminomethyl modification radical SAM/GNAT enzyme Elp3 [Candidatus Woesearchaeota archaeon]